MIWETTFFPLPGAAWYLKEAQAPGHTDPAWTLMLSSCVAMPELLGSLNLESWSEWNENVCMGLAGVSPWAAVLVAAPGLLLS